MTNPWTGRVPTANNLRTPTTTTTTRGLTASQSQVLTSSAIHFMPNMDVRHMSAVMFLMLRMCRHLRAAMSFLWVDITLPTSTNHQLNTGTTQVCHQSFLILQSWLETLKPSSRLEISGGWSERGVPARVSIEQQLVAWCQATWDVPLHKVAAWLLARLVLDINNRWLSKACLLCGRVYIVDSVIQLF